MAGSLVALGNVAQLPRASAAPGGSASKVQTTTGPAPAQRAALDKPRGFVYRVGARHAATRAGASGQSNPDCPACQPPLLFAANTAVMGGGTGTPGHVLITPVYWAPSGYGFTSSYRSIINGYLTNVAAASHTNGNVFAVADQYYQQGTGGPVQHIDYAVAAGTEVDTSDAYPAQGGPTGCGVDSGYTACVTDGGLQTELNNTLLSRSLSADDAHLYMVFFPPGVETCVGPGVASQTNPCSSNAYCGYHSGFYQGPGAARPAIYANEPYPPLRGCADPFDGAQAPNGDPYADAAISVVSHEANEAITNAFGAWQDAQGFENGDECAFTYGVSLGSTGVAHPGATGTMYNQTINGAHYFTQGEFSNSDYSVGRGDAKTPGGSLVAGCVQRPDGPYHPLPPARVADTRPLSGEPGAGNTIGPTGTLAVQVTGTGGVPGGSTAVVLNVTATNTTATSFFTVYPTGAARPLASSLNVRAGSTVPNLVEVGLGPSGQVSIYNNAGTADAVVDVEGYVGPGATPAGAYNALSPARIADTRGDSNQPNAGQTLGPAGTVAVRVAGVGGVPLLGAAAVVLNVTATNVTAPTFLTAFPDGTSRPLASNLNVSAGQTAPNRVIVPVGTDGNVRLYNYTGSVDVVVDVSGWFTDSTIPTATGASFNAAGPTRLADTRRLSGEPGQGLTLGPGGSLRVPVTGTGGVPASVNAVVINLTVTNTTAASFLTAYPTGQSQPLASDLNWAPGETRANLAVIRPGSDGSITVVNNAASTDVIVDVTGYYQ
ncbi:MAG: hypothetical protein M3063_03275 [Actinomycetota bacterium]|nr:hypothetical protein [Actinomycetota bacterium]